MRQSKTIFVSIIFLVISLFGLSCSDNSTGSGGSGFYKIAFVYEEDSNQDIYTINPDGTELTQLTDSDVDESRPVWSPDGKYIYYQTYIDNRGEIFRMDIDGSNKTNITNSDGAEYLFGISQDGTRLAYTFYQNGLICLCLFDLQADSSVQITGSGSSYIGDVKFTPDGNSIIYTKSYIYSSAILMVSIDGSVTTTIADNMYMNNDPQVSPDARKIAYVATHPETHIGDIGLCDIDGTDHINISFSEFDDSYPCWSPDGTQLVYSEALSGGEAYILKMNADGTERDTLTTADNYNFSPEWSPDGSKIAYVRVIDGDLELYIMNADGTGNLQLTDNSGRDENPVWSPGL